MKKGFTLIELLISITFLVMLGLTIFFVFLAGFRSWTFGQDYAEAIDSGSLTMEKMMRDLSIASEITSAESDVVVFEADINGTGVETVQYDVDRDGSLIRTVGTAGGAREFVLVDNVQNFSLGYYLELDDTLQTFVSAVGQEPTASDSIRVVAISLSFTEGDKTMTLGGSVYTRNQGLDDG